MAAAHRSANSKSGDGWWKCVTCGQDFTGAMQLGLAEAWWSTAQRLPEEDVQRLAAAATLANALHGQDKHAEAVTLYREVLAVERRVLGPNIRTRWRQPTTWLSHSADKARTLKPRQCNERRLWSGGGTWGPSTRAR